MEMISVVVEYLAIIVDPVIIIYVFAHMFETKNRKMRYVYDGIFLMGMIAIGFLNVQYELLQTVLLVLWMSLYTCVSYQGKNMVKVLYVFAYLLILTFVNVTVIQLVALATEVDSLECSQMGNISRIPVLILSKFILIFVMQLLIGKVFDTRMGKRELGLMVTIFGFTFVVAFMVAYVLIRSDLTFRPTIMLVGVMIGTVGINVIAYILLAKMNAAHRLKERADMLSLQMEQQKKMYTRLDDVYQQTRTMKHDLKHYFSIVLALLKEKNYQEAEKKIEEIIGEKMQSHFIRYTGNDMINAVINDKQQVCYDLAIPFNIQINGEVPKDIELEIAVLLANLLDNAIEAEKKEENPDIRLMIAENKGMLFIEVDNMIAESVLEKNPQLYTSKKKKLEHGIGLISVKEIVNKLDGLYQVREEEKKFITMVSFSIEKKIKREAEK